MFNPKPVLKRVSLSFFVEFQEEEHIFVPQKYWERELNFIPGKDISFIWHKDQMETTKIIPELPKSH